jgi:hypothetical protein
MDPISVPVDDGSTLVLYGVASDADTDARGEAQVLGSVTDFIQDLAVNGLLFGVAGNATFELLKALAQQLRQRAILAKAPAAGLEDVRNRVADALTKAGHTGAVFTDITHYADQGWELTGTVAAATFTARTDAAGQVIHLRVG